MLLHFYLLRLHLAEKIVQRYPHLAPNELVLPIIQTLKPQQVDYSIDLLMDQHQFIAICLFIMTISALFLFLVFLFQEAT